MTRNPSSDESVAPEALKEGLEPTPPSTSTQAQQAALFGPEPVSKDGFQLHERDADDTSSEGSLTTNPFLDPEVAAHWTKIYEEANYECRGVFDPHYSWTPQEEKKLIRKIDFRVCTWACIMFFGLQVDRGNLKQAVSDNMLSDLNMNTNDYNLGNTVFLVCFLLAELPSQLISKKMGPDRWIPLQITLWSTVAMSQAAIKGKGSFLATRALLGTLEGGFIPDIVLWLSYFYTSRELPIRLSYFWTTLSATTILTSILAFALLRLRGVSGWGGWQWLFLIEGLITACVGLASWFMMPASAVQTKTWFRPNGWFTDHEVNIAVNRVLRDDPSKGNMNNREAITPKLLFKAMCDYDLWPIYLIGLLAYIPQSPVDSYITLTIKGLGFNTFTTNLLAIPASFFHICTLLLISRLSDWVGERSLVSMLQNVWTLPCLIALRVWPGTMANQWGTYALVTTLLSYPYCHAIVVAWSSRNANDVGARTVSAALYNMLVQVGNVIANQIYREDDKPLYHRGNRNLIIINCLSICVFIFTKCYYVWKNKRRERIWDAMSPQERIEYTKATTDRGSRRLDFRFAH